jgi:hypothetical protein
LRSWFFWFKWKLVHAHVALPPCSVGFAGILFMASRCTVSISMVLVRFMRTDLDGSFIIKAHGEQVDKVRLALWFMPCKRLCEKIIFLSIARCSKALCPSQGGHRLAAIFHYISLVIFASFYILLEQISMHYRSTFLYNIVGCR